MAGRAGLRRPGLAVEAAEACHAVGGGGGERHVAARKVRGEVPVGGKGRRGLHGNEGAC